MNRKWTLAMMTMALLATAAAAPTRAETVIPPEWVGIWETVSDTYDCGTNALLFHDAATDTLCPGAVFTDPSLGEVALVCTSSADAGSYTSHCEGVVEVVPGCTVTVTYDITGTRSGDSFTSTATMSMVYAGECFGSENTCQRTETTATRIAGAPNPCEGTANEDRTWGAVKSLYR